jgi:type II secretory pathway pseudopilin PulG
MLAALFLSLLQDPPPAPPAPPPPAQDLTREQIVAQDIEAAIKKLSGDDYWEAALARNELLALGRHSVKPLIDAFHANAGQGPDDEKRVRVRYWVCEILGDLREGSDEAQTILTRSLEDKATFGSSRVCAAAAASLAKIGSDKAIDALKTALEGPLAKIDRSFKAEVIIALGNLRAKTAEPLLREAFKTDDGRTYEDDFEAQRARVISCVAAEALGKIRAKDSVNDLARRIDAAVTDPLTNDKLESFIIRALQRINPELAAKPEADVRKWAKELKETIEKEERTKAAADKIARTKETMTKLEAALRDYQSKEGKEAPTLEALRPKYWPEAEPLTDGWGKAFSYRADGTGGADFDLVSYGDDGLPGGADVNADLWNHDKWTEEFKKKTAELLKQVADAVVKFRADQNRYPFSLSMLFERPPAVLKWPEKGYLPDLKYPIKDPWGGDLMYLQPGKEGKPFEVKSLGRDQKEGGEGLDADVSIWSLDYKLPDEKK